ncbi:YgjP-like metallopeptidase domain-containing protein [Armatimonas sp.]|uniref:YgjP-like metallopeptidase domain-containing protein n=1 Tax=Armatimonas sp. TaxID=1872638 RepID=UPI0037535C81
MTERHEIETALWEEFHRLNETHFVGTLRLSELLVSTRKKYGGYCQPQKRRIVVSWQAFLDHGWDETLITFRHEVAHLVHPNHSAAFWALAEKLGCPPDRKKALPPKDRSAYGWWRYAYECPGCHARVYRRKRLTRSSCARCDRKFNPQFLLHPVKTLEMTVD